MTDTHLHTIDTMSKHAYLVQLFLGICTCTSHCLVHFTIKSRILLPGRYMYKQAHVPNNAKNSEIVLSYDYGLPCGMCMIATVIPEMMSPIK